MVKQEFISIPQSTYIYRCVHRIMEGDCQMEHGPLEVTVGPVEIQKYTVTNAMFYDFMTESGYKPQRAENFLKHWENGKYKAGEEDLPVVNVSQDDAKAYAEFYGLRLPTEQEWQFAAAGPKHFVYPWGNEKEYKRCNVYGHELMPVNALPEGASPFGLHNMCGNVWEYTSETHFDGDRDHYFITLRGGSFYSAHNYWHAECGAVRNDSHLKVHLMGGGMDRFETVGFRCVREVSR